jgi:hypothetical protein
VIDLHTEVVQINADNSGIIVTFIEDVTGVPFDAHTFNDPDAPDFTTVTPQDAHTVLWDNGLPGTVAEGDGYLVYNIPGYSITPVTGPIEP